MKNLLRLTKQKELREESIKTNKRLDDTNNKLVGFRDSVIVLQQCLSEVIYELQGTKEILSDKVI